MYQLLALILLGSVASAQPLSLPRMQEIYSLRKDDSLVRKGLIQNGFRRVADSPWEKTEYYGGKNRVFVYHSGDSAEALEYFFPEPELKTWEGNLTKAGARLIEGADPRYQTWADPKFMYVLTRQKPFSISIMTRP